MTIGAQALMDLPSIIVRQPLSGSADGYVRLCEEIAKGLDLPYVGLRLKDGGPAIGPDAEFRWPPDDSSPGWILSPPRTFAVLRGGQPLAVLILPTGKWRRLDGRTQQMLDDVLSLLGAVLDLARLAAEQQDAIARARGQAERIAVVRRQAFAEQDRKRRNLERDLHDGTQHHLVALRMDVGLLDLYIGFGDLAAAQAHLIPLRSGIEQAERVLFSTAAGGLPPRLLEQGLAATLGAELSSGPPVNLGSELPPGKRYSLPVETAVYFVCLEAVNNARKHAPGASIQVKLTEDTDGLRFAVIDDGPGLGPGSAEVVGSFGLGNMRSRIESVGGRMELSTAQGVGTTVAGVIPQPFLV